MDGEDIYSDLRVASFSCYLDSAEESFVPKLAEGVPDSPSTVISHQESPYSNNLKRSDKADSEVNIFGAHKDFSDKNGVCMRCRTIFACEGTCLEKQTDHGVHGMVQSQSGLKKNVEQFSFPVLNSRMEDLKVKMRVTAEIATQGDEQNSVGSGMTKKDDIAVNLARKLSRLTWDAIPNTQSRSLVPASSGSSSWYDDTASDDSSDLFEIENTSSTRCSMLSRQEPSALSKAQNFVKAGAADKSLTVSDDKKRYCKYAGDLSSTYKTTTPKDSCKLKSGARWLLGCKSSNAVRIEENTSRISESAKGGKKYPSTREGPSPWPLQPEPAWK